MIVMEGIPVRTIISIVVSCCVCCVLVKNVAARCVSVCVAGCIFMHVFTCDCFNVWTRGYFASAGMSLVPESCVFVRNEKNSGYGHVRSGVRGHTFRLAHGCTV